jgi:hypothetical protein
LSRFPPFTQRSVDIKIHTFFIAEIPQMST